MYKALHGEFPIGIRLKPAPTTETHGGKPIESFTAADRPTMVIDTRSRVERDPIREQRLVMWDALGYRS